MLKTIKDFFVLDIYEPLQMLLFVVAITILSPLIVLSCFIALFVFLVYYISICLFDVLGFSKWWNKLTSFFKGKFVQVPVYEFKLPRISEHLNKLNYSSNYKFLELLAAFKSTADLGQALADAFNFNDRNGIDAAVVADYIDKIIKVYCVKKSNWNIRYRTVSYCILSSIIVRTNKQAKRRGEIVLNFLTHEFNDLAQIFNLTPGELWVKNYVATCVRDIITLLEFNIIDNRQAKNILHRCINSNTTAEYPLISVLFCDSWNVDDLYSIICRLLSAPANCHAMTFGPQAITNKINFIKSIRHDYPIYSIQEINSTLIKFLNDKQNKLCAKWSNESYSTDKNETVLILDCLFESGKPIKYVIACSEKNKNKYTLIREVDAKCLELVK